MSTSSRDAEETLDAITQRREALGLSQADLAEYLADVEGFEYAASTYATRIGEWCRGEEHPDPHAVDALGQILDCLEAHREHTHPRCSNPRCERTPEYPPDIIEGNPYCIVCGYSRGVRTGVPKEQPPEIEVTLDG